MGNNSGGSHSIAYGLTVDHVIELTRAAGRRLRASSSARSRRTSSRPSAALPGPRGRRSTGRSPASATPTRDEIRARYPAHWRRVAGYNLNELVGIGVGRSLRGRRNGEPRPPQHGAAGRRLRGHAAHRRRGQGAADAPPEDDGARRHPLPGHPGGARVLAVHPGDRALRGRADRQDHPRPGPRTTSSSRSAWASSRATRPPS